MEANGYAVQTEDIQNLNEIKDRYNVPPELRSCHTAIVDGYVIEGHVPVEEIERLLAEHPDILGIAVAGMPVGSPGMEVAGTPAEPFEVVAFDQAGETEVFASYPK
jgi:hypothetical protein